MKVFATYRGDGAFNLDAAALDKIKPGKLYRVEITQPRNLQMHRLYWKLCELVADALNASPGAEWTQEGVSDWLKVAVGHVRLQRIPPEAAKRLGTDLLATPASIAFHKMDQIGFRRFFDAVLKAAVEKLLPHLSEGELRERVERVCGVLPPLESQERAA